MLWLFDRPGAFANRIDVMGFHDKRTLWLLNQPDTSINRINVWNVHVNHFHGNCDHPGTINANGLPYLAYVIQPIVNTSTMTYCQMDGTLNITNRSEQRQSGRNSLLN